MLLALVPSAKRQSDLHALDLTFMQYLPEGVEFKIPGLTKTRVREKMSSSFSQLLKAMFSCARLPVSGNTLRRQKITETKVVIVSPCF